MDTATANRLMNMMERMSVRLDAIENTNTVVKTTVKEDAKSVVSDHSSHRAYPVIDPSRVWSFALTKARIEFEKCESPTLYSVIRALYLLEPTRLRLNGGLHTDEDGIAYHSASFNIGTNHIVIVITLHLYGTQRNNYFNPSRLSIRNPVSNEYYPKCVCFAESTR